MTDRRALALQLADVARVLAQVAAELAAEPVTSLAPAAPNTSAVPEYLDDKQLAAWLGVSRETCQAWRRKPDAGPPFHKVNGRLVRYVRAEVQAWIDAGRSGRHVRAA